MVANVRTTPLTWGFQASVMIRMRWEMEGDSITPVIHEGRFITLFQEPGLDGD